MKDAQQSPKTAEYSMQTESHWQIAKLLPRRTRLAGGQWGVGWFHPETPAAQALGYPTLYIAADRARAEALILALQTRHPEDPPDTTAE